MGQTRLRLALAVGMGMATSFSLLSGDPPWTLEEAIREARENNPEARIMEERRKTAGGLLDEMRATTLPQVHLSGGYSHTNEPMRAFGSILNTGTFSPTLDFNRPGTIDHFQAQLMVAQSLYRGGETTALIKAAQAGERAARWSREATLEHLSLAVVHSFFAILQSGEQTQALEAEGRNLEESLRVARARFERGQLLESELLNIEVQRAQVEERLLAAEHQTRLAEKSLQVLMGRPPAGELQLEEDSVLPFESTGSPLPSTTDRWELRAQKEQHEAALSRTAAASAGSKPQVEAFAGIQYDRSWRIQGEGDHWMAGLRVQWALFDGNRTAARSRQARAEAAEIREAQRRLELELEMQREQARLNYDLARRQYEVASSRWQQAEKSASISRARFESGDLLTTELIGAESRLSQARIQRSMAEYQIRIALAELRWASGHSLLP